jgi:threonine/homoserine/homoserine lactone efflux protein
MDIALLHFVYGTITCIIGALPFGLVNLSVVDITINKSEKAAILFSIGASLVEILFAIVAIIAGQQLSMLIAGNAFVKYGIVLLLFIASVYFFTKKYQQDHHPKYKIPFLLKGMFYNLISIQVLLYWFLVITFLQNNETIDFSLQCIIGFSLGVGFGKMGTLFFYRLISRQVKRKAVGISKKINQIIGGLLLFVAFFQLIKTIVN